MTVRMTDFEDDNWSSGRSYLSTGCWQGDNKDYRQNVFRSDHGLVEIYEQTPVNHRFTSMRFVFGGRDYMRRWGTTWGVKTQARLAREFIKEIVGAPTERLKREWGL